MLKELGHKNIGLILPLNIGSIAITASQFGYKHYNENIIGISLARSFGPNLRIGLKLDYLFFKFSGNYKNKSVPTFEIGMQYNISESLCLGAYVFNPINVMLNTPEKDKIPIIMRLGFSYYVNKEFLITSEIEENFEYNFSYRFGIEYCIYNKVFVRSGFQLNPELFTFGIGYDYKRFVVDVCAQMPHGSVQQVQVILDAQGLEAGTSGGIQLAALAAVAHIDLIHIVHQIQSALLADILIQRAAEIVGDIVFAVGKCTCTAETAHNRTAFAVDAGFNFITVDGTVPLV
mgnify:CR=1 FL=1